MTTLDALRQYAAKRNFGITPEPALCGQSPGAGRALSFVIQKHWASSLHYDLRLELDGNLKSWAVPKGPSFDPKDKRMAVQVEDHPLSYASFEGTIPARQYGAGKVIVWDKGFWQPATDPHAAYLDGNLKFELFGHKLHGKWVLVRIKGKSEKQQPWLLIKEKDAFARPSVEFSVVDELPDSVQDLVTLPAHRLPAAAPDALAGARRAALPALLAPQLATLATSPPADPQDWVFEIKFDGYRILTRVDGAKVQCFTRSGHDWSEKLGSLHAALAGLGLPNGWYDGEIVVANPDGLPDFGALQAAFDGQRTDHIILYLFDLPFFQGRDLRAMPLDARRALLQQTLEKIAGDRLRFSDEFNADARSLMLSACKMGLEGMVAKRRDSRYISGRSADWIKLKCKQRQEFVIGGYTDPQGARTGFGALLLGVFDAQGQLQYAGNVGTGFKQRTLAGITKKLDALTMRTSPFAAGSAIEGKPHWVQPELVAEVSFGEWTSRGHLRHAVFHALRSDKPATSIVSEEAAVAPPPRQPRVPARAHSPALPDSLAITHPERMIDAATGITKIELVRYYRLVGELMMEHLLGRPVSLLRAPAGVGGAVFFQKHLDSEKLAGIRVLDPALDAGHAAMIAVENPSGLLAAAQRNVIEFHTHNGLAKAFTRPDRMVFDLDPGEGVAWQQVQEAAQLVHAFLAQLGLTAFLKTSGGKGLHIVVPVRKMHSWDTVKRFSQDIVSHLASTIPQRLVARSGPRNRVGKIFIDYLRNGKGATTVCAWSARARPGLGISVPLAWDELAGLRGSDHWNVRSAHERLATGNTPWDGYRKAACSLTAAMAILN